MGFNLGQPDPADPPYQPGPTHPDPKTTTSDPQTSKSILDTPTPPRSVVPTETQLPFTSDESDTESGTDTTDTDISQLPSLVPPEKSTGEAGDESTFGQTTTTDESGNRTPTYKPTFTPSYKPTFTPPTEENPPRTNVAEQAHIDRQVAARQSSAESGPHQITVHPYQETPRRTGYTMRPKPEQTTDYPAEKFVTDTFRTPPRDKYPNP